MADIKFTVCALLYGDYPDLARRCLEPLFKLNELGLIELRVGLNEVCDDTSNYVLSRRDSITTREANPQIFKYPMMRELFYSKPITTDYLMWFDDDSYIKADNLTLWLSSIEKDMESCDMLGSVYGIKYGADQRAWCETQPWYRGKPIPQFPRFATGGWWCIRTDVLRTYDWPIKELKHCGGDVALGILLAQNDLKLRHTKEGVAINADSSGKESAAQRRGASKTERPIGKGFTPNQTTK